MLNSESTDVSIARLDERLKALDDDIRSILKNQERFLINAKQSHDDLWEEIKGHRKDLKEHAEREAKLYKILIAMAGLLFVQAIVGREATISFFKMAGALL